MIDWVATNAKFGITSDSKLGKRPKVVCRCDICNKSAIITVRVKSRLISGFPWKCPSCICLGRSVNISEQMKEIWLNDGYRENQLGIKQTEDYKTNQSEKSKQRWQNDDYRNKLEIGINVQNFINSCELKYSGQFTYDLSTLIDWHTKTKIICNTCGTEFERTPAAHLSYGSCPFCRFPIDLKELVATSDQLIINDRSAIPPFELDLYWPKQKFAIEYHGLYWHSYNSLESTKDKLRHQAKALACIDKGIRLVQIFDYEWKIKKHLINSMINHMLGKSIKLMARNLTISVVDNNKIASFFSTNHLQGHRSASVSVALFNGIDIVMAMSFSKHSDGYEIMRMATKIGYHVSGGAGRLLHHFKKLVGNCPIYTFADLRHSTGNVYSKLGFKLLKITKPGYHYYKNTYQNLLSRQQCQKHKLNKLLGDGFRSDLSEPENMFNNGYRRVWDAGHLKFML